MSMRKKSINGGDIFFGGGRASLFIKKPCCGSNGVRSKDMVVHLAVTFMHEKLQPSSTKTLHSNTSLTSEEHKLLEETGKFPTFAFLPGTKTGITFGEWIF